jgi:hypothetical protein
LVLPTQTRRIVFLVIYNIRAPQLSVFDLDQFGINALLEIVQKACKLGQNTLKRLKLVSVVS